MLDTFQAEEFALAHWLVGGADGGRLFVLVAGLPQLSLLLGSTAAKPVGLSIINWRGGDASLAAIARVLW